MEMVSIGVESRLVLRSLGEVLSPPLGRSALANSVSDAL
jgi:hypothetical protein